MRLCATGRRQKVENERLTILILNKKQNLAGYPANDTVCTETHSELASFSSMSINQAAD